MSQPLLQVSDLTMQFGGITAVDSVGFEVYPGEILALIGPNGAGKTTTLNLLSGLYTPTRGDIRLEGRSIRNVSAPQRARMGIARTYQVVKPFEGMSVVENVATGAMFGPRRLPAQRAAAVATQVLEQVGLAHKAEFGPEELTIADRKRLELARALAMEPKLLLLDEVMAGLNLNEVQLVMDLIREINRRGVTIILIEHVMKVVMGLSQRVVVLRYGKLLATGTPGEIITNPQVVEAYLGKRYSKGAGGVSP